jgi:Ferritin-like
VRRASTRRCTRRCRCWPRATSSPQPQDFATIGHLYRSIEQGLARLAEKFGERHPFVGPPRAQATSTDFHWPELVAVTDLASAQRALATILEQGEGARGHWEAAHFGQFVEILEEYRGMRSANPGFDPVRPVMFATVRRGERDDSVPVIGDRVTAGCADLFNVGYEILLQILERYFAHTEETDAQLGTLANAAVTLMAGVLGPLGDLITTLPVGPGHPGRNAGPSFELFYEDDDLLPHRESAWALLEERLREAVSFCDAVAKSSPEDVASALGRAQRALTGVADSLARHFADWGATSRFVTTGGDAAIATEDEPMHFEEDVKPLFRERDRDSMRFAFDLWSVDDVSTHADAILGRLEAGTMPCDGAWPADRVDVFRRWIGAGKPA